uniref:MULE transposase domain-containing protein n=1 Tax=Oryza brachyantha TaxID=4533 RepID=J3MRY8_ORYBR
MTYLARRIAGIVQADSNTSFRALNEVIFSLTQYRVKYEKAQRANLHQGFQVLHAYNGYRWYFPTGKYKDTLLTAIAMDGNDQLLPIAFALAEGENNDNWSWFMSILRLEKHKYKYVIGKFKGLCYLLEKKDFKKLKALWNVLKKPRRAWLKIQKPQRTKWAQAYDEGSARYEMMTTNVAEVMNNVLGVTRAMPMSAILEFTFKKCNKHFVDRYLHTQKEINTGHKWAGS